MERLKAIKQSLSRLVADVMASNSANYDEAPKVPPQGENTRFEKLRGSQTSCFGLGIAPILVQALGMGIYLSMPTA